MTLVRWADFPLVAASRWGHPWLQMLADLQMAPNTIKAYGHGLEDYLTVCGQHNPVIIPEEATREDIAGFVRYSGESRPPMSLSAGTTGDCHDTYRDA